MIGYAGRGPPGHRSAPEDWQLNWEVLPPGWGEASSGWGAPRETEVAGRASVEAIWGAPVSVAETKRNAIPQIIKVS